MFGYTSVWRHLPLSRICVVLNNRSAVSQHDFMKYGAAAYLPPVQWFNHFQVCMDATKEIMNLKEKSMSEATFFVTEAVSQQPIQQIEQLLNSLEGVERVLIDTADGEIKVEFDDKKISKEQMMITLQQHHFHIQ
ncbi:heavy-metal-associated domain-containing protein [Anoxybacteroides rupiense]|uniref:heavy-metal-associated domain-containing protein n=1 Tax=Anoxybacteroides rupiense TaxID=311460 RepID=UPI0017EB0FE4|nr:hypothetical protein [Anoxybacillus rupiensis]MBB3906544.1 copper chaperone CopZ [Anoxybacillus rupiensis]